MKLPAILLSTFFIASPAFAGGPVTRGQRVYRESHCYENVEQYIPGYYNNHGQYVGGYVKHRRNKIPCGYAPVRNHHTPSYHQPDGNVDNNDCSGGTAVKCGCFVRWWTCRFWI